ncbi:hypothetical protein D3C78_1085330 [compost metagenome]
MGPGDVPASASQTGDGYESQQFDIDQILNREHRHTSVCIRMRHVTGWQRVGPCIGGNSSRRTWPRRAATGSDDAGVNISGRQPPIMTTRVTTLSAKRLLILTMQNRPLAL